MKSYSNNQLTDILDGPAFKYRYVDKTFIGKGSGSQYEPFDTIQKAIDSLNGKDGTILIRPGSYEEILTISNSQVELIGLGTSSSVLIDGSISCPEVTSLVLDNIYHANNGITGDFLDLIANNCMLVSDISVGSMTQVGGDLNGTIRIKNAYEGKEVTFIVTDVSVGSSVTLKNCNGIFSGNGNCQIGQPGSLYLYNTSIDAVDASVNGSTYMYNSVLDGSISTRTNINIYNSVITGNINADSSVYYQQ